MYMQILYDLDGSAQSCAVLSDDLSVVEQSPEGGYRQEDFVRLACEYGATTDDQGELTLFGGQWTLDPEYSEKLYAVRYLLE